MPWKEVKPMDQKLLFLADYLRGGHNFTVLCRLYGISRKTGYKWLHRYQESGFDALNSQSRQPNHQPLKTPYNISKAILELRNKGDGGMGAKKIQALLALQFPSEDIPSRTTIYNILRREGLVQTRHRKQRVPLYPQPFDPVEKPNELWSTDFKGQFKLGNGMWCFPLTIMDHHSRFLLACDALTSTKTIDTKQQFEILFRERGLPLRIRSDNGVPFATKAAGGLSQLSIWWIRLGVQPERIEPGQPQQNGRHERMHRTLKQATTHPPARSLKGQQKIFDEFIHEYNHHRPHEALGQKPPAECYLTSERPYPNSLPEVVYPDYYEVKKVRPSGVIYWHSGQVYISHLLVGEYIGLIEIEDGIWDVYFSHVRIGGFDEREVKGTSGYYLTIKV